jgi:DNA-directed RNA polymerase subunit M/transcription elongation factor TFIIS
MAIPPFRQEALAYLTQIQTPVCMARMLECAAFQGSNACRDMYALLLEEMVTYHDLHPDKSAVDVLGQCLQPLPCEAPDPGSDALPTRRPRKKGQRTCPRCRSKVDAVIPFEKQRRSADEPANQYIQCLNNDCRHVWRTA